MRKSVYEPLGPQESFIVPLLSREVENAITEISSSLIKERNNTSPEKLVLDCGCGNQPFRNTIIRHGFNYESLDISQNDKNNIDYLCALDASLEEFSSRVTKAYSLVLATEVLEHVSNWHAAFANIAACMEPGGYALITAPFFYPLHEEPYDYCRPTVHLFDKISADVGLELYSVKKLGNAVDVIGTTLGAARILYTGKTGIGSKILNRILARIQSITFSIILHNRNYIGSDSNSIYLSNVVVLKKV